MQQQSVSAGPPSHSAVRAGGAGVHTNSETEEFHSHSNEVLTPSPERLCLQKPLRNVPPSLPTPATAF